MGMVLTYLIIGAIISVGTILLRYYLSERKKQPRNDKFKWSMICLESKNLTKEHPEKVITILDKSCIV